jgi:hypothetical protein
MAPSIYRRLTGRARSLGGYSQLWIAPDHILLLRSTRFREHYARFALADIQAVVITELPSRTPLQAALAAVPVLWMFASTLFLAYTKGFFLVTGGIALAFVIADIARGPRCRCFLHTAVSREPLTPVGRMRIARKFLAQLQPAIEAVQGAVAAERIQELEDRSSSQSLGGPSAALDQPPGIAQSGPPGYLPEVVFGMFLINAALILASVLSRNAQVINVLPTTLFAEVLLVVVALFRRGSRDPRRYIYVLMMVALLGIGWDLALFAQSFGRWIITTAENQRGQPAPVMTLANWTAFERGHAIIAASWRFGAGLIGLAAAYLERPASPARLGPQPVTEPPPK